MAPLLDTHVWIWWIERDARLDDATLDALDTLAPDRRPYLSAISLWEVAMLVDLGRRSFPVPLAEWLEAAAHPRSVQLVPVSPAIAAGTAALPATFHRDPADRLIAATALELALPLVTRDQRLARVPDLRTIW